MQFTIQFLLNNNLSVTSKDIVGNPSIYQQLLTKRSNLSCIIQFDTSDGVWEIEDELPVLAAHFFLRSVHTLSTENAAKFEHFEYYGRVSLNLIDNHVYISGDFVKDLMIEFSQFKNLSIELGKHTIELLEKLDHPKFQPDLEFIHQALVRVID